MIVLDGTPGAGKTTRVGALLTDRPDALVFPEAQPPPDAGHPADLEALLDEDRQRTLHAAAASTSEPDTVVASDRCHLGVLAYRHALAVVGGAPRTVFDQARERATRLDLDARHHDDDIRIVLLSPAQSQARRARFADDPRYRSWFDPEFLRAYNAFFDHLDRWSTPGPRWTITAVRGGLQTSTPTRAEPNLRCAWGCSEARSPVVIHGQAQRQLYTAALHLRTARSGPVSCLRSAEEIAKAWHLTDARSGARPQQS